MVDKKCPASKEGHVCALSEGHHGGHYSMNYRGDIVLVWENENDPEDDEPTFDDISNIVGPDGKGWVK